MPPARTLVVGRDRESSSVASFLADIDALPAALVIEGEPGIGKSTLWQAGVAVAHERGYRVLLARPAEAEAALGYAVLGDLLGGVVEEAVSGLPEPQRHALEVALLLRPSDGAPLGQLGVATAFLGSLRALASRDRLLIAIDDLQWLDPATAAALAFAARRLGGDPIGFLLARRTGPTAATLELDLPTERCAVSGLSLGAIHALVHRTLEIGMPRRALQRLHELSRGNPYYALELADAWRGGALRFEPGEPLPPDLEALLGARVAALPATARRAVAVAAATPHPTVPIVGEVVGRLAGNTVPAAGPGSPTEAVSIAADGGVVLLDGDEIRFAHPLLAASAYAMLSTGDRRTIHASLATLVAEEEERARHLALATADPDESVAAEVERAADAAFRRGAPTSAADLVAMALRLTPEEAGAARLRRSLAEVEYRFEAGETEWATEALGRLVAASVPGPERAMLLARQARVHHFGAGVRGGVELFRQALAEAGDDPRLRVEIEEGLAWGLVLMREDLEGADGHAASAVHCAEELHDDAALAETLAALALTRQLIGRDGSDAMQRAMALEPATLHLRVLRHPSFAYGYLLTVTDRLDDARDIFRRLETRARERGDESALAPILMHLSVIELLSGAWDEAAALADEAHAVAEQNEQVPSQAAALARKALLLAHRGLADQTRATAGRSLALTGEAFDAAAPGNALARGGELAIWALGHLALALEDHGTAVRHLVPLCDALLAAGIREPGEIRALPDAIEALVGAGRLDRAADLIERLDALAGVLARPSALAAAGRSRALLAAASGDLDRALAAGEAAAAEAARAGLPFDLARTWLVLGTIHRRLRSKRVARERLSEAEQLFEQLGAERWAARARAEAARIGGRAPSTGELTATEQRVAELVAEGRSNKEVGAALFVSTKTVEANLSRIYAKLGIQSRMELLRVLASAPRTVEGKDEGHP